MHEPKKKISRRKLLALLGMSGIGTALYTRFVEPEWIDIGRFNIKLPHRAIPKPIRILHLSDLHASEAVPLEFIAKAVRLGLDQKPDLVLLTGDFITGKFDRFDTYAELLSTLTKSAPCYATLGNHDGGLWARARRGYHNTQQVRNLLSKSGVTLLHNSSTQIRIEGTTVHLIGLGDLWAGEFSPATAFAVGRTEKVSPILVLSHNPDTKEQLKAYEWDVVFCGHTHGGQLRLPLIGTPFAPVNDMRFVKGLHSWEGRWIYVTKGVGNLHGVRFNCRPEVSAITLN
jgi:predicted MPP superfamily phosphohydrolase